MGFGTIARQIATIKASCQQYGKNSSIAPAARRDGGRLQIYDKLFFKNEVESSAMVTRHSLPSTSFIGRLM